MPTCVRSGWSGEWNSKCAPSHSHSLILLERISCVTWTQRFDSAEIKACHRMRPWASFIHMAFSQHIFLRPILILLYCRLAFQVNFFELDFTPKFCLHFMSPPSQLLAQSIVACLTRPRYVVGLYYIFDFILLRSQNFLIILSWDTCNLYCVQIAMVGVLWVFKMSAPELGCFLRLYGLTEHLRHRIQNLSLYMLTDVN
jgi:hypothetical protein